MKEVFKMIVILCDKCGENQVEEDGMICFECKDEDSE